MYDSFRLIFLLSLPPTFTFILSYLVGGSGEGGNAPYFCGETVFASLALPTLDQVPFEVFRCGQSPQQCSTPGLANQQESRRMCIPWGLRQGQGMFIAICLQLCSRICLGFNGTGVKQERRPLLLLFRVFRPAPTRCQFSKERGLAPGRVHF